MIGCVQGIEGSVGKSCGGIIVDFKEGGMRMSIAGDLIRGHTDAIILARLLRGDSYGYEINKTISILSSGRFELKEATLYTAFKRLEELGYTPSYRGESGAGARRRSYTITPEGREACAQLMREWEETKEIMDKLLESEERL